MPKKAGIVIIAVGAVLILSALLLFLHNRREDAQAGQEAESLLADVEAAIAEQTGTDPTVWISPEIIAQGGQTGSSAPAAADLDPEMPVVMLDGYEYVGYMQIPALALKLPVMADWDYTRLKLAPCRQFGSSRTDDLVIAAHNYESHFGRLKELKLGDYVIFTDMDGIVNLYSVEKLGTLDPSEVDAVQNSGYDLVLYTCTAGAKARVTVFCTRTSAAEIASAAAAQEN